MYTKIYMMRRNGAMESNINGDVHFLYCMANKLNPTNLYGRAKIIAFDILCDMQQVYGLHHTSMQRTELLTHM